SPPPGSILRWLLPAPEPGLLPARGIEVGRVQPALECGADRRPFAIDDREPGGIAVFALHDHVLAKETFIREPEAHRSGLRGLVAVVALPFEAAIAEFVEHVARGKEKRLGRDPVARELRTPQDVAELDDALRRLDSHQGLAPGGLAARPIDDRREEERFVLQAALDPATHFGNVLGGEIGQVVEPLRIRRSAEQALGMGERERLEPRVAALEYDRGGMRAG